MTLAKVDAFLMLKSLNIQQKCLLSLTSSREKDLPLTLQGYKRGTGGRSSFSGKVATVFGATGVMGRILVNRLGKQGSQVMVPHRCDEMMVRPLKLCGDLGQIVFTPLDLHNEDTIRNAIKYSNIVINCLGTNWETSNWKMEDVHVKAAHTIARLSREYNVDKLVHFSSLNVSPDPQKIYSKLGSKYLRTKYDGELAVKSEFPRAYIIRPSTIYGEQDNFLYFYSNPWRRGIGSLALWNKGEKTIKQPVHQIDVANGIMKILNDYGKPEGGTYDFVGPKRYLLSELIDFILSVLRRHNVRRGNMSAQYLFTCYLTEKIFKKQKFNFDFLEREFINDVTTPENETLKDLGIEFQDLEKMIKWHLKIYNRLAYYDESLGEFADPIPPQSLPDDFELQQKF